MGGTVEKIGRQPCADKYRFYADAEGDREERITAHSISSGAPFTVAHFLRYSFTGNKGEVRLGAGWEGEEREIPVACTTETYIKKGRRGGRDEDDDGRVREGKGGFR